MVKNGFEICWNMFKLWSTEYQLMGPLWNSIIDPNEHCNIMYDTLVVDTIRDSHQADVTLNIEPMNSDNNQYIILRNVLK